MGVEVNGSFNTDDGFTISTLYLNINTINLKYMQGGSFTANFTLNAYKSYEDRQNGTKPLQTIPPYLTNIEAIIGPTDFLRMTPFMLIYAKVGQVWASAGYQLQNVVEVGQYSSAQFTYDASGYNFSGFNSYGYNRQGFNSHGYNAQGYDAQGYNAQGYNALGYDKDGYNAQGLDKDGNSRPLFP